jgi:hypothetical protein
LEQRREERVAFLQVVFENRECTNVFYFELLAPPAHLPEVHFDDLDVFCHCLLDAAQNVVGVWPLVA